MIYPVNRIPASGMANRFKATKEIDGTSEYIKLERADNAIEEGTDINRKLLMNIQGFDTYTVEFGEDYILETNSDGDTLKTTFPEGEIAHQIFTQVSTGQSVALKIYREGNFIKTEYIEEA